MGRPGVKPAARIVTPLVRAILSSVCRVERAELAKVPDKGPLIVVMNHINFLEVPLIFACLWPRSMAGLVKQETWDNPVLGALAELWEAIPIDRAGTDLQAMRRSLDALSEGRILLVAPEGTRSGHGRLQKGHGGVIQLAARSGAPLVPLAHWGGESFWDNLRKPRRTAFHIRVGEAFALDLEGQALGRSVRERATEEVMRRIAALLPEAYRGFYSGPPAGPERHIRPLGLALDS